MSKIIVFEGPDRCGKKTQTHMLRGYLASKAYRSVVVEVPIYGNPTYNIIYWMLGNGLAKKFPKLFQWFQYFNRKIFQTFSLPFLLRNNDYVILDRWSLSTVVYGTAEGVDTEYSEMLANKLVYPDYTILLLGQSHMGVAEDVYEADNSLQERVKKLYRSWSVINPVTSTVIDCNLTREEITEKVKQTLIAAKLL
jgi:thymidylate kinase